MEHLTLYIEADSHVSIQEIESLLNNIEGIERALVDVSDGEVKIDYAPDQVSYDSIVQRLEQQGLTIKQ